MVADPFGRAIRDHYLDRQEVALIDRDGEEIREHPIERFYFGEFVGSGWPGEFIDRWVDGPVLDMGAGVGRHAMYFQDRFETVAIEVSEPLVQTMHDRGVEDARLADMFELRYAFPSDRFRTALAIGTQLGLAGSTAGLRRFLSDLAFVTGPDATAVLDCYDPESPGAANLLGYRHEPVPGMAYRVFHFEYEGDVGETLLFRLVSPSRLCEAAVGTGWAVAEVSRRPGGTSPYYVAALSKR